MVGREGNCSQVVQLLTEDGRFRADSAWPIALEPDELRRLLRLMILTRALDRAAVKLQRQGQLGAYPPALGQEAAAVGSALALHADDWVFPAYRELGAAVTRSVDLAAYFKMWRGVWHSLYDPYAKNFAPLSLPIGTQTLHATGFALGMRLHHKEIAVLTYLGDGATSGGDPHEAMNFAAVFSAPVIFFVQNNQYAISVPVSKQTRGVIADRAAGYGMPGIRVDGNDVLATWAVTRHAVEHARAGGGPTVIEALTYRMDGHSTADDPTRYRPDDEVKAWAGRDPIERFRRYLLNEGLWSEQLEEAAVAEADEQVMNLRSELELSDADPRALFDHVFTEPTPALRRQRAQLELEIADGFA